MTSLDTTIYRKMSEGTFPQPLKIGRLPNLRHIAVAATT
jgi:predicted DNA-binding transcriptional regulator AlpA